MTMSTSKITQHHLMRQACVYIRQSTPGQVRFNQESTERQYNLKTKALAFGWNQEQIRVLDGDLGQSGSAATNRADFKILVGDVAMGHVGAIFSLEASRLARSNQDWHRLLELCAITNTLVIDEDGCYNPAEFNDSLVLGMKGAFAQAELHIIRARLHGGKLNKAAKGELRFPLPVGFVFEGDKIVLDPDQEVQGAVRLIFSLFEQTGSAFGVVRRFKELGLRFPRRAYGGAWDGKLVWGPLNHSRVTNILTNPSYAGVYVFGRYQSSKEIGPAGEIAVRSRRMPQEAWRVMNPRSSPRLSGLGPVHGHWRPPQRQPDQRRCAAWSGQRGALSPAGHACLRGLRASGERQIQGQPRRLSGIRVQLQNSKRIGRKLQLEPSRRSDRQRLRRTAGRRRLPR